MSRNVWRAWAAIRSRRSPPKAGGLTSDPSARPRGRPSAPASDSARADLQRAFAEFAIRISRGDTADDALLAAAQQILASGPHVHHHLVSFCLGLQAQGVATRSTQLALGLAAADQASWHQAADEFARASPGDLARHAALPAVRAALAVGDDQLVQVVLDNASLVDPNELTRIAGLLYQYGALPEAQRAADVLGQRADDLPGTDLATLSALTQYLKNGRDVTTARRNVLSLAVLHPQDIDPGQGGKPIESALDALAIARLVGDACSGEVSGTPELVQAATVGWADVGSRAARVDLRHLPRDATRAVPVAEGTLSFVSGALAGRPFSGPAQFPYHPAIRPFFVGIHVSDVSVLSAEGRAYLAAHAPIGCRDHATVELLQSAGIDAFYSGCVSLTLVQPPQGRPAYQPSPDAQELPLSARRRNGERTLAADLRAAELVLASIQANEPTSFTTGSAVLFALAREHGHAVRLTGAKPGAPANDGPVFARMGDPVPAELARRCAEAIRETVRLAQSQSLDAARSFWSDYWHRDVRSAWSRLREPPPSLPPVLDVQQSATRIRESAQRRGPRDVTSETIEVALALDANLIDQLPVTIEGVYRNASRPLRVWVLGRGLNDDLYDRLESAFPDTSFVFMRCDDVPYGGRLLAHISVSTMDRLLLPEILHDVGRVVYVDIDALFLDDIAPLYDLDLQGHPLAARPNTIIEHSCFESVRAVSSRLEPVVAAELRRRMHRRFAFDFPGFNAGVLVLDLDRMRSDGFCDEFIPWLSRYDLHDQQTLLYYCGPGRVDLDDKWNAWPYRENQQHPAVLHWIGPLKPWRAALTRGAQEWREAEHSVAERLGRATLARTAED